MLAPLLFLADNLIHPEEFERGNERQQVAEIADHYTAWQLAHALGFLAALLLAAAVLGLAFLVRRRQPRLGLVAGALALTGLLGLAAAVTIDGYTWGVIGEASTRPDVGERAAAAVLDEVQGSTWSYVYYLTPVAYIAGLLALAVGLARQGAVPRWSAALLVLATLMVGTETAIPENAYFIAGAAVFLAAGAAVAWPLWRMTDADFAAGGTSR